MEIEESSKKILPWLVAIAFFMEALDTTILNTAVPVISSALNVSTLSMKAVLASYTLALAVFIPMSGWVADRFGTKKTFAFAISIFCFGSFLCGISSNIHFLVFCRILQGCGGAMMVPVGRLVLVRSFPKSQLIRIMSFVAIPALIGPLLGPLFGGAIVEYSHWRLIFFINIPIGILGLFIVHHHLPNYRQERSEPLDLKGIILFSSAIALFSYVLEIFGEHEMSSTQMLSMLFLSILLFIAYIFHASKIAFPLLQLKLLRIRTFRIAIAGSLFTRIGVGGVPFLLPLLYQVGLGLSPIKSGLFIMPQALAAMSSKLFAPKVLKYFGYRKILIANTIIIGFFLMLFATINQNTSLYLIILQALCYGTFMSLQHTSMNTLVYADIIDEKTSNANSIASTVQQMSMSFGVASAGLVTAFFVPQHIRDNPEKLLHGIHAAFVILGLFTIFSAIIFSQLKNSDGENVSKGRELV